MNKDIFDWALVQKNILQALSLFQSRRVLIFGDVLLDHYLYGDVKRISPEAPVPVVNVRQEGHMLGGAGNVARNVAALGGQAILVSAIGEDPAGDILLELCKKDLAAAHLIKDFRRSTIIKSRIIAQNQQIVRIDREISKSLAPLAETRLADLLRELLTSPEPGPEAGFDAVIISDYAKGVVTEKLIQSLIASRAALQNEPAAAVRRPLIILDPKPQNISTYRGVDLLTPNAKETAEMAGLHLETKNDIIKAGLAVFRLLKMPQLMVTMGAEGIAVFEGPAKIRRIPTAAKKVFDVTGAGDTVIASLSLALAAGLDLLSASILANAAAGITVAQVGAGVATPEELSAALHNMDPPAIETWLDM